MRMAGGERLTALRAAHDDNARQIQPMGERGFL
jgi:hypothetical protein